MNREQHLKLADDAVTRAERLAGDAERYANHADYPHKVAPLAAAGAVWADIARAHAAIANATDKPLILAIDEAQLLIGGTKGSGKSVPVDLLSAARQPAPAVTENTEA